MKRYTQYSIAAVMFVTALLAVLLARTTTYKSPQERYTGTWQIVHGVDNTAYSKRKIGMNALILVDTQNAELAITSDRLFHVSSFKTTGYEILHWEFGIETKLKLRDLRSGFNTHVILKRDGETMIFAFVDSKTKQIDQSAKGNQIVYTANRQTRPMQ